MAPHLESRAGTRRAADVWIVVGLTGALAFVVGSMVSLWKFKSSAGDPGHPPARWPSASRLECPSDKPVLLMFAHPHCPCTRASLAELRGVVGRFEGRVNAQVLFIIPDGVSDDWRTTDSWHQAAALQGVQCRADLGGRESRVFQAKTSGHVMLYDRGGHLAFSGGITSARGHMGENPGVDRLVAFLQDGSNPGAEPPVFGCPLHEPESRPGACCPN